MIALIMGTTGSGKTTVGALLAERLGWEFADADDFHPAANVEKMRQGIALTDGDRSPWLEALHTKIIEWQVSRRNGVLTCSALKETYRRTLLADTDPAQVKLVYLKGTYELFSERVLARQGHFAKQDLLASQFAALEEPSDAIVADTRQSPEQIVADVCRALGAAARTHPITNSS